MERILHIHKLLLRSARLPWVILGVTLSILAAIILMASCQLRAKIREQITGRDGEILDAVALMQQMEDSMDPALVGSIDDPGNQMLVILKTSRLKGVLAARRFDAEGRFAETFPLRVREGVLREQDISLLKQLKPVNHFYPAVKMSDIFLPQPQDGALGSLRTAKARPAKDAETLPLLEVNVPLHAAAGAPLVGIAQFLIAGHGIAAEFAQLDRNLWLQGLAAFLAGGSIIVITITLTFRRLRRAHQLLAERTQNLLRANQELTLAAKTSAVGAVTAHLIHGLKNPLFGLQNYVSGLGSADNGHIESDWQQAVAFTRRMQNMINEVMGVLREEEGAGQYEISLTEVLEIISGRLEKLSGETGVCFSAKLETELALPSRGANLLILILLNLLQNAIEASPKGKSVSLSASKADSELVFEVRDEGAGIPEGFSKKLFQPCRSEKEGGSGLGLAISKQLANHLGARLELKSTGPAGSVFVLGVPLAKCLEKAEPAISISG